MNAQEMAKYMQVTYEMTKANADKIASEESQNVEVIDSNTRAVDVTFKVASHALMLAKHTYTTMQFVKKLCDIY